MNLIFYSQDATNQDKSTWVNEADFCIHHIYLFDANIYQL